MDRRSFMDRRDFLKGLGVGAAGLTLGMSDQLEAPAVDGADCDDEEFRSRWIDDPEELSASCEADYVTIHLDDDSALLAKKPELRYTQNIHRYSWDGSPDSPIWYIGGRTTGVLKIPKLICPLESWKRLSGEMQPDYLRPVHKYLDIEFNGKDHPVDGKPVLGFRLFRPSVSGFESTIWMVGRSIPKSTSLVVNDGMPICVQSLTIAFRSMELTWNKGEKVDPAPPGTMQHWSPVRVMPGGEPPPSIGSTIG